MTAESLKSQGEGASSGATIARLSAQMHKQASELDLVLSSKNELEKLVKEQRQEIIESERKATDYYN